MRTQAKRLDAELHPCNGQGVDKGEQVPLDFSSQTAEQIAILYYALQAGLEVFGGADALAAEIGKSRQLTRLRVMRKQDTKGETQKSTLDMLAHITADPHARWKVLTELCSAWGAKPPEARHQPTAEEKLRALQQALDAAGEVGGDIRRRAAKAGGFDPSSFGGR